MWVAQIGLCLGVCLAAAFFLGRWFGQRRFFKVQEEMKALETSFHQLLEQMELVSGHNLKVLQSKTEELRDLLHIADKKCLYTNDLLQELETGHRDLQNRLTTPPSSGPAPTDLKFRRDIQETVEQLSGRIQSLTTQFDTLETTVRDLEAREALPEARFSATTALSGGGAGSAGVPSPRTGERGGVPETLTADSRRGGVPKPRGRQGGTSFEDSSPAEPQREHFGPHPGGIPSHRETPVMAQAAGGTDGESRGGQPTGSREKVVPLKWRDDPLPNPLSAMLSGIEFHPRTPEPPRPERSIPQPAEGRHSPQEIRWPNRHSPSSPESWNSPDASTAMEPAPPPSPETVEDSPRPEPGLPLPTPGTPVFEVLKLAKEGVTIPQIARLLQMGKGEVELILNLYGSKTGRRPMRKVM